VILCECTSTRRCDALPTAVIRTYNLGFQHEHPRRRACAESKGAPCTPVWGECAQALTLRAQLYILDIVQDTLQSAAVQYVQCNLPSRAQIPCLEKIDSLVVRLDLGRKFQADHHVATVAN
jgi:hypothetical protein